MRLLKRMAALALAVCLLGASAAQTLEQLAGTDNSTVAVSRVKFEGKTSVRLLDRSANGELNPLVILPGTQFRDGTIEADVVGRPAPGAAGEARGFVGLAFRVQPEGTKYEAFYIRPTNGRAEDQLRRNHSTQYVSEPDYPWRRLRTEQPGVYESYADMVSGRWTHLRIVVAGAKARLYIDRADQPALIVNDLKQGAAGSGAVALWIGPGTEAYFSNVRITPRT